MDNIRIAIGHWLARWHAQIAPVNLQMQEYVARPVDQSIAIVPGKMIDAALDMLNLWTRNDTHGGPSKPARLPVVLLAVAHDWTPTPRDWGHNMADPAFIIIQGDPKERVFELRTQMQDVRCQLVFFAHEPDTARQLAAQFGLWAEGYGNKSFDALWRFAGQSMAWPMKLESDDLMAAKIPTDAKNLAVLALDFTFKVTQPFFRAPKEGEPNDGKGVPLPGGGIDPEDPSGWPMVQEVSVVPSLLAPASELAQPLSEYRITEDGKTKPGSETP